ncbi:MAG TPA: DUF6438 domain-containing protein [Longimicrobium sp.]|nr:DUF6438 domain-containing protein [Longimicrobium sp.]
MKLALFLVAALAGCSPPPADTAVPATGERVDSIALERLPCFGTCPVYRVVIARTGRVRFAATNPATVNVTDSVAPQGFAGLAREADAIGFWTLPGTIAESPLCGPQRTDGPSAVVTLYTAGGVKEVHDYQGCAGVPAALRAFEERIDRVTRSERWVRPAHRG